MDHHYKSFLETFYKFIFDLNRYSPNDNCEEVLQIFDKLDIVKIIYRTHNLLHANTNVIEQRDEILFQNPFIILPDIDLSVHWPKLIRGQKEKLWTYMKILLIESELLMHYQESSQHEQSLSQIGQTPILQQNTSTELVPVNKEVEFNPYVGIGCSSEQNEYNVNDLFAGLPKDDESDYAPGLGMVANMMGLDKKFNMEELSNQLKNMKPEDIENATNNIKDMLGPNVDQKTSDFISDMLTNISQEMSSNKMKNDDPIGNIMNIAKSVAEKIRPQVEENKIDMSQLLGSTKGLATQCRDKNGNPMFTENNNPFMMLEQLTSNMKANGSHPRGQFNENQLNEMLRNMGLNNMDLSQLQRTMNKPAGKPSGKKKKNRK